MFFKTAARLLTMHLNFGSVLTKGLPKNHDKDINKKNHGKVGVADTC